MSGGNPLERLVLQGIGVSSGVVIAPAFVLESESLTVIEYTVARGGVDDEICRLEAALIETRRQIKAIQNHLEEKTARGDASIFDAHLMVLDDRAFIEEIVDLIRKDRKNAEWVVSTASLRYAEILGSVQDDYLRERVSDIRDVARRIIRNLFGCEESLLAQLPEKHVIVADDLAPSFTATLTRDYVGGFVTEQGSPTSHTAVMARAMEIPAIVALPDVCKYVETGNQLVMDGSRGVVIVNPTQADLDEYGRLAETRRSLKAELRVLRNEPAETPDGHRVVLSANAESAEELDAVIENGAQGIGLFRSEYLYLSRDTVLGEEEEAALYAEVVSRLAPNPVIIRTLDLGGDKFFNEAHARKEANPFLGCRSIRLSLLHPDNFKRQLRAILRASASGNVKLMYPMIGSVAQVVQANEYLREAQDELRRQGVPFDAEMEVGVMIEIPSAALTADAIARQVDFFSVGTNDLVQYTLAVDRINERVAYLYEPTHPAVLRLLKETVDAGHRHDIWVGLCGEMAASPLTTPLLLGLGFDELSVTASAVPLVKDVIRSVRYARARELAETALTCESGEDVLRHCRALTAEVTPELLELI